MDENLINQTQEVQELDMLIDDVEDDIDTEEMVDVITVEQEEEVVIDIGESMGWVSGDNRYHDSLLGVDFPRQHPIEAITNLREELDEIERLKTVYSDKINIANYYKWKGAAYDTYGYFVSIVEGDKIQICDGKDIFGVVVNGGENPDAGFIGGQDTIPRDNTYGIVVTSGIVDVRCELDVDVGDYVVSNSSGYAKKSESNYGYKVVGTETKDGIPYAVIALGVQADITNLLGAELSSVESRVSVNEKNIVSAINVANQAYNKAESAASSASVSLGQVEDALKEILGFGETLDDIEKSVMSSSVISAQAKAIAESAATSAASMRDDAVKKANEALSNTDDLREELEAKAMEIGIQLNNASSELERAKEDIKSVRDDMQEGLNEAVKDIEDLAKELEPLATWPEGATGDDIKGIAGFVAQANKDSATLADMVEWKDGDGDESLAGVVRRVTEENAEIQALASYKGSESSGAAGIMAEVDANKSAISAIASESFTDEYGNTVAGLAGLQAQVEGTKSEVSLVASQVNTKYATIFKYTTDEALKPDMLYSKWLGVGSTEREYYYYADNSEWDHTSPFNALLSVNKIKRDTVYYEELTHTYWYFQQGDEWAETYSASDAGLPAATGGLQIVAYENKAQLDAMVSYDKDGKSALAGLTSYVDENSSEISTLASYSNENSKNSGTAGLIADVDNNTSALSLIADYSSTDESGTEFSGLAGLRAQVDRNKSELLNVADYTTGTNYTPTSYADGVSKTYNGVTYTVSEDGTITTTGFALEDSRFNIAHWTNLVYPPNNIKLLIKGCPSGGSEDTYYIAALNMSNPNDVHYDIGDGDTFMSTSDGCMMWIGIKAGTSAHGIVFKPLLESVETEGLAAIKQSASRNSSSIHLLSSWKDEANTNMARIEQKADANGAYIQSTVTNLDKYSVGPYSQAYGFTVEQADDILEEGMIYVPTVDKIDDKKEIYKNPAISIDTWDVATAQSKDKSNVYYAKDTKLYWYYGTIINIKTWLSSFVEPDKSRSRSFVRGYLYQWSKIDGTGKWITVDKDYSPIENEDSADCTSGINTSSMAVYFSTVEIAMGDGENNYGYWYTNGTDITDINGNTGTYEPYTLYKWDSYVDENGDTQHHWVAVATLAGNYQSRAVSFIRQDANSIELSVTALNGAYAGMQAQLDSDSAKVNSIAAWPSDAGSDKFNMAILKQHSDGNSAHLALAAVRDVDGNGTIEVDELGGAKIVLTDNAGGSYIQMDADHINFEAGNYTVKSDYITFTDSTDYTVLSKNITLNADQITFQAGDFGGRNLILNTSTPITLNASSENKYKYQRFDPTIQLQHGKTYSFGADVEVHRFVKDGKIVIGIFNDTLDGASDLVTLDIIGDYDKENLTYPYGGHISGTITISKVTEPTCLLVYAGKNGYTDSNSVTFSNIKFEEGNISTAWTPAPEDQVNAEQTSSAMKWKMSPDKCVWWNTLSGTNSEESPLMRIDQNGLYISGEVEAKKGKIGAWNIGDTGLLYTRQNKDGVYYGAGLDVRNEAWNSTSDDYNVFAIGENFGNDDNVGAWRSCPFRVTRSGKLIATNADIDGKITATEGKIGAWDILPSGILASTAKSTQDNKTYGIALDSRVSNFDGSLGYSPNVFAIGYFSNGVNGTWNDANFKVKADGTLVASQAQFLSCRLNDCKFTWDGGWTEINGNGIATITNNYEIKSCISWDRVYFNPNFFNNQRPAFVGKYSGIVDWWYEGGIPAITNEECENIIGMSIQADNDVYLRGDAVYLKGRAIGIESKTGANNGITIGNNKAQSQIHYLYGSWKLNGSADVTSDRNMKHDIEDLDDRYAYLFDNLKPVRFKYNYGTSNRYHTGFIAQDVYGSIVDSQLTTADVAVYVESFNQQTNNTELGLRYDEFISLNTWQIQKLKPRISTLEEQVQAIEERVQMLETENAELKEKIQMSIEEPTELPQE